MLTNRNSFLVRFIMLLLLSAAATLLLIDRFSTRQILYDHRRGGCYHILVLMKRLPVYSVCRADRPMMTIRRGHVKGDAPHNVTRAYNIIILYNARAP